MFKDGIGRGKEAPKFEVNFVVRDKSGKATVKRKTFSSNSAEDMSNFFNKHSCGAKKRGNKGNKGNKGKNNKGSSSGGGNS